MKTTYNRIIKTCLVGFLVSISFLITASIEYERSIESDYFLATDSLSLAKSIVENNLTSRIISTKGLITYIQTQPELSQETFSLYAKGLYESENGIVRNMSVLKDTTIAYVYPLEGNETALGKNLATIEGQKDTVLTVKATGKMRLTAPVNLVQGGTGIIVRLPIFLPDLYSDAGKYWGQMSLVFDYDMLVNKSGLITLGEKNWIELYEIDTLTGDKKIIWSNCSFMPTDHIQESIDLYQANWTLSMARKSGWNGTSTTFWLIILLGLFTTVLASIVFYKILLSKDDLALKVKERTQTLEQTNEFLEQNMSELQESQAELTEVNSKLESSIEIQNETQSQLIVSEKLAALGELVAGVAHEINTPLGISVTLGSFLADQHHKLAREVDDNTLSLLAMQDFIQTSDDALTLLNTNLNRASSLVSSFKQVAVDQTSQEIRRFNVYDTISDVLKSLQPKLKNSPLTIKVECDKDLSIISYPGALTHIITNFIINSLIHGFPTQKEGLVRIGFTQEDHQNIFTYEDNGLGITEEHLSKVFNPFFSTRKKQGSTGLGLHIIHNIVTQTLNGQIQLTSTIGQGVHFQITFDDVHNYDTPSSVFHP